MKKPVFVLLVILGVFDGLTPLSAVRRFRRDGVIVAGSTFKGVVAA
jgi:hypothetical protein